MRRRRSRYLLAVTLVASAALCADRATAAAAPRVDAVPARGLVDRLTDGFRRTVATRPIVRQLCPRATSSATATVTVVVRTAAVAPPATCPSHLPQPPPAA